MWVGSLFRSARFCLGAVGGRADSERRAKSADFIRHKVVTGFGRPSFHNLRPKLEAAVVVAEMERDVWVYQISDINYMRLESTTDCRQFHHYFIGPEVTSSNHERSTCSSSSGKRHSICKIHIGMCYSPSSIEKKIDTWRMTWLACIVTPRGRLGIAHPKNN